LLEENAFLICILSPLNKFAALALCGCFLQRKSLQAKGKTTNSPPTNCSLFLGRGLIKHTQGDKRKVKLEREKTEHAVRQSAQTFLVFKAYQGLITVCGRIREGRERANKKTKQE
jgi:hypothetical protein